MQNTSSSKSVEHIIPESLGNKEHILPVGYVCDKCNNYFSRKVEKKVLDSDFFKNLRFRNSIISKKGRYPSEKGIILNPLAPVNIKRENREILSIGIDQPFEWAKNNLSRGKLILPIVSLPKKLDLFTSRFLAKIGLEYLVHNLINSSYPLDDEFYNNKQINDIRTYARYGKRNFIWPYYFRRIYPENKIHYSIENDYRYEILHEITFLLTNKSELYLILVILGIEFVFNMGGPYIDGYEEWLKNNYDKNPTDLEFCKNINYSEVFS